MRYSNQFNAFCALVQRGGFVVLDTETTGLHDGEICQIAIVQDDGSILMNEYVRPVRGIPADATRIHGITDEMVADAPGWAAVAPAVQDILTGKDVIIYNAVYDRKMMHQSGEKAGIDKIEWKALARFHCAMEAYAEYAGDWNSYHGNYRYYKLTEAARHFGGIPTNGAHGALADCRMTLAVVCTMVSKVSAALRGDKE